jgi:hypothetical protein
MRVLLLCVALTGCAALDARVTAPHPLSNRTRELGGLSMVLTPALMFAVNDQFGDKAAHCFAGFGTGLTFSLLLQPQDGPPWALAVGILKETWDADQPRGKWDNADLAWTAACGVVPWALIGGMP